MLAQKQICSMQTDLGNAAEMGITPQLSKVRSSLMTMLYSNCCFYSRTLLNLYRSSHAALFIIKEVLYKI